MARTKNRYRTSEVTDQTSELKRYSAGIYIRLSKERTEAWRNKSQSLETQEKLARTFAKEHGLTVVKCYTDYEYSGTNFMRPAFQEMMEDIKKGVINCILIRDLSRLGRDYIEMGRLIDKVFPFLGVRFISINDNLDTLSGLEEKKSFEVEIKNLVNDMYSKDISKKLTAYNIYQANQGYYIGTSAPYGYRIEKEENGSKLVIDKTVKIIVDMIFQQALGGKSMLQITNLLNEKKVAALQSYRQTGQFYRCENDSKIWKSGNLLRLIKSPVYKGELVQRKSNKAISESDYIHLENAQEAYITNEEYNKILSLSRDRKSLNKSNRPRTQNRYKGLIFACGKHTQLRRYCKHLKRQDYYYFMDYVNSSDDISEKKTVYISELALDKIILKLVKSEMERLGTEEEVLTRLTEKKEEFATSNRLKINHHKNAQKRLQAELSELYMSYSLNRQEREEYLTQKNILTSKIDTLSEEIVHCQFAITQLDEEYRKQIKWLNTLVDCQEKPLMTVELLNALIERIEVDANKSVTVTFRCQIGGVSCG
ncbi:recombinase family protein [Streptococcus equi subsp. zooepidemicus]|uniref:recombinase family protein n=1 Tax=Streptococcus equi TaxID=1336 RepID=UPI0002174D45|nr:recombinase family protein [Streptococcus equi]AEJ25730.1 site-specific recombinase [Streptococcus equi subsp. zooepidemicus ATCC 35246]AIA68609.1 hypothetical protein Q426_01930 [Streptococcus equi subsp. zooepidemicus CY]MBR7684659.1 recombinase family protein [Streptococcus equi subsp. zooepidemicus]MBR7752229.1 recombinase family protein [Streptococcus equi subsp. zooepidemicus]MBR7776751.1 recombinase family protein [Streptococcus equi subsp. zooepidemicus]